MNPKTKVPYGIIRETYYETMTPSDCDICEGKCDGYRLAVPRPQMALLNKKRLLKRLPKITYNVCRDCGTKLGIKAMRDNLSNYAGD